MAQINRETSLTERLYLVHNYVASRCQKSRRAVPRKTCRTIRRLNGIYNCRRNLKLLIFFERRKQKIDDADKSEFFLVFVQSIYSELQVFYHYSRM